VTGFGGNRFFSLDDVQTEEKKGEISIQVTLVDFVGEDLVDFYKSHIPIVTSDTYLSWR
jgi:hypothetical protein